MVHFPSLLEVSILLVWGTLSIVCICRSSFDVFAKTKSSFVGVWGSERGGGNNKVGNGGPVSTGGKTLFQKGFEKHESLLYQGIDHFMHNCYYMNENTATH